MALKFFAQAPSENLTRRHGMNGDGYGRAGQFLRPSPRSFLQGNFKFTKVLEQLPTDKALLDLIKRGLDGTPMYPWDLSDEVLLDIIQYIKSLFVGYVGPRWFGRAELGMVKEPFSMGVLTSGLNTDFLQRALPTVFGPSFNPGILVRNEAFNDRLFWSFGVFRFTVIAHESVVGSRRVFLEGAVPGGTRATRHHQ